MKKEAFRKESAHGMRVWRIREAASMPVAHIHADLEMNLVLKGEPLRYLQRGRIVEIPVGRLALFWGGIPHQLLSPETAVDGVWLTLPLPWVQQWKLPGDSVHALLAGEVWWEGEGADDPNLTTRWVEDFESGDPGRHRVMRLEIEARVHRMLLNRRPELSQVQPGNPAELRLQEITAYLTRGYSRNLKVDDIAAAMGLNPRYLMRLFKNCTGLTVWEYILRLRIAHAQHQLITTDAKMIDIAMDCGFDSLSSFYRAFKEYSGSPSPGQFRRQYR